VEEWKKRRQEIEEELNRVWVDGGEELQPPPYAEAEQATEESPKGIPSEDSNR
jgi:ATP-binding cassette subfamily D (ALD) long-chain fatty acid import protein